MADLEPAEISETAPWVCIPVCYRPLKFDSSTKSIRRTHSFGAAAVVCETKSTVQFWDVVKEALPHIDFLRDASPGGKPGSGSGTGSGSGSGSGGGAGEGRNGRNQGVGGGGQREGIGNERRGNHGRNHGGANGGGGDDGDDRGGWVGYIGGERGPMGPGPHRWVEIQLAVIAQMIGTLESFDIRDLPARARIFRVVSFAFNSVALVVLSASIGQRRTNPRLASILSWIGSFATLLGFMSMIAMALAASFIP